MIGTVYLIGAGPGDPGLLTVRGLELLRRAQMIVHDRLISIRLLSEAPKNAEIIDAGKELGHHALSQDAINAILVQRARAGKIVVRLKGGDPFLYGRGGEEAEALAAAGIPFEVVPGVSSALAVPAYAGIPVTHRQLAAGLRIMTGHRAKALSQPTVDPRDTVVALMAVSRLSEVVRELIEDGWPSATPAAVIERGTTAQQRTIVTRLEDAVAEALEARVQAPAILVVGDVVRLRERIRWAEARPLAGLRALVLSSGDDGLGMARRLESMGAECQWTPVLETRAPKSWRAVDAAIDNLRPYSCAAFLTAQDVDAFLSRLQRRGYDVRALTGVRLAVPHGAAADALAARGLKPDVLLRGQTPRAVAMRLRKALGADGDLLLIGQGKVAERVVALLRRESAEVTAIVTFTTVASRRLEQAVAAQVSAKPDVVVLQDAASVATFVGGGLGNSTVNTATVGTDAARAARQAGLRPVASARDAERLVREVIAWRRRTAAGEEDRPERLFPTMTQVEA